MPLTPTTPQTASVFAPATKSLDRMFLKTIHFDLVPGAPAQTAITVTFQTGYMSAGTFMPASEKEVTLSGPAFVAIMQQNVTPGTNHYNDLRAVVWQILQATGDAPAGTVA